VTGGTLTIYELKGESDIADLVQPAGGLTPEADSGKASLSRVDESQRRVVVEVDLSNAQGRRLELRTGDSLRVTRLRPQFDSGVQLNGYVYRPGAFAWHEGMRLTEVIGSVDEVKPDGDLGYVLIRRELPPDRHIVVLSADLNAALRDPASPANVVLMPRDRVTVFDLASGRERILSPLISELRIQGGFNQPTEIVRVEGRVKVPGEYPLEPGMRVSDLIRAGGSLSDAAYGGTAELTRYEVVKGGSRETEHITVDLAAVRRGDAAADIKLRPFDYLNIKEVPAWGELEQVTLRGEVKFPGTYPIWRGETLKALVERAGGGADRSRLPPGSGVRTRRAQAPGTGAARYPAEASAERHRDPRASGRGFLQFRTSRIGGADWDVPAQPASVGQGRRTAGDQPAEDRHHSREIGVGRGTARRGRAHRARARWPLRRYMRCERCSLRVDRSLPVTH
jgi:protein involved in polysaccharide export with SLBB domain